MIPPLRASLPPSVFGVTSPLQGCLRMKGDHCEVPGTQLDTQQVCGCGSSYWSKGPWPHPGPVRGGEGSKGSKVSERSWLAQRQEGCAGHTCLVFGPCQVPQGCVKESSFGQARGVEMRVKVSSEMYPQGFRGALMRGHLKQDPGSEGPEHLQVSSGIRLRRVGAVPRGCGPGLWRSCGPGC